MYSVFAPGCADTLKNVSASDPRFIHLFGTAWPGAHYLAPHAAVQSKCPKNVLCSKEADAHVGGL
jgi:hypothetical protein